VLNFASHMWQGVTLKTLHVTRCLQNIQEARHTDFSALTCSYNASFGGKASWSQPITSCIPQYQVSKSTMSRQMTSKDRSCIVTYDAVIHQSQHEMQLLSSESAVGMHAALPSAYHSTSICTLHNLDRVSSLCCCCCCCCVNMFKQECLISTLAGKNFV
jgi:hypothetical protein